MKVPLGIFCLYSFASFFVAIFILIKTKQSNMSRNCSQDRLKLKVGFHIDSKKLLGLSLFLYYYHVHGHHWDQHHYFLLASQGRRECIVQQLTSLGVLFFRCAILVVLCPPPPVKSLTSKNNKKLHYNTRKHCVNLSLYNEHKLTTFHHLFLRDFLFQPFLSCN